METNSQYMFYRDLIIFTQRGNYRGKISNAKPVFIISLIDAISEGIFTDNKLCFGNEGFDNIYYRNSSIYNNNTKVILPFYHLDTSDTILLNGIRNTMVVVIPLAKNLCWIMWSTHT